MDAKISGTKFDRMMVLHSLKVFLPDIKENNSQWKLLADTASAWWITTVSFISKY